MFNVMTNKFSLNRCSFKVGDQQEAFIAIILVILLILIVINPQWLWYITVTMYSPKLELKQAGDMPRLGTCPG